MTTSGREETRKAAGVVKSGGGWRGELRAGLCVGLVGVLAGSTLLASVRIGLLLPPDEPEGVSVRRGVELAVERVNAQGTKEDRPIELIVRGRVGQWGDDGGEAALMVLDDGVQGLLAPPGGEATHLTLQVAGRTAVPVVSLCGDSSVTDAGIPWSVRVVPRTTDEAGALFAGLKEGVGVTRWLALIPCERAGREVSEDLKLAARLSGVDLIGTVPVPRTTVDFSVLYRSLPREWPDGVLLWMDAGSAGHMAKYLRTIGFKGWLAGPARLGATAFREAAGSSMEGVVFPRILVGPEKGGCDGEFEQLYQDRHGQEADPSAVLAHDGARLLIEVLRRAGEGEAREQFPVGWELVGATGPLRFDTVGNRIVTLHLVSYRQGRVTELGF